MLTLVVALKPCSCRNILDCYGLHLLDKHSLMFLEFLLAKGNHHKIRPHRFGGEGVLIGGQNSNTKCSMTFVNIAVAISALAGGAKNGFAPRPEYGGVFDIFRGFLGV